MDQAARVRRRTLVVWLTVTAALLGLGRLAAEPAAALLSSPGPDFAALLEQACGAAALVAAAWLWLVATDVAVGVARGRRPCHGGRAAGPLRTALLVACGVAVLSSTAPAAAGPDGPASPPLPARVLDGLPMPDRATAADVPGSPAQGAEATAVRVRPGDSLWAIAAARLGPTASAAHVASYSLRVQALNADLIGPDPDLVLPGQQLRLPPV